MENMMDLEVFKGYEIEMLIEFKELICKLLDNEEYLLKGFILDNMEEEFLEVFDEFCDMAGG